jgi:hypothetical protein
MQVQDDAGGSADLDLRHYVRVVGRRRWIILAIAVLVGLASMGYAFTKEDRYRASADLLLLAPSTVEADAQQISTEPDRAIANEIEILGSEDMTQAVRDVLGDDFPDVDADAKGDNDVVVLTAESTDPDAAAESVNAYATAYERLRRQRTVAALRQRLTGVQDDRQRKQAQLTDLLAPLNNLDQQLASTPVGPARDALLAERAQREETIAGTRDAILGELGQYEQQIADLQRAMRSPTTRPTTRSFRGCG